jgi:protein-S-isoprenylcysteine O-methyltransferase Ste14
MIGNEIAMESRRHLIFTAVQILAAIGLFWTLATRSTPWNAQRYIGTALVVVGISFIAVARYQLGKSFAIRAKAHELVTRGLYSKVRNPIYVFGIVMFTGVALIFQMRSLWIALAVIIILQTMRARREARVLETAFGDTYREYRRKTWF